MKRDLSLDSLRGLFLLVMMIDHFVWFGFLDSPVLLLTARTLGFVTAADGFYFLSGLVAGMVYSGAAMAGPIIWKTAAKRAFAIYLMHLIVLALCCLWYYFVADYGHNRLFAYYMVNFSVNPLAASVASVLLVNQPHYHDILTLYVFFTLLTPFVIRGLQAGLWWLVVVLSVATWAMAPYLTQGLSLPLLRQISVDLVPSTGGFDWFAYQALYVAGLLLGWLRRDRGFRIPPNPALVALSISVLGCFLLLKWNAQLRWGLIPWELVSWIEFERDLERTNFPWLRAINFAAAAYLVGCIARHAPRLVQVRFLILLGQNALLVFAFHVVVLYTCSGLIEAAFQKGPIHFHALMVLFVASAAIPAIIQREHRRRSRLQVHGST